MSSQVPNPEGLPEIRDVRAEAQDALLDALHKGFEHRLEQDWQTSKRNITPLHWLLMQCSTDQLLRLVDRLHLKLSITCEDGNTADRQVYRMRVFTEGMLQYQATGRGLKAAICNCLAQLLHHEQRDIHGYAGGGEP